jgi:putative ABC transport system ATP-binding protein
MVRKKTKPALKAGKVIEIIDLDKIYGETEETKVHALKKINISVKHTEFIALMGPSGSGKSTLMNILGFLDSPSAGRYLIDGVNGSTLGNDEKAEIRNKKIGFVFQGFNLLPRTSALENVMLPLYYRGGVSGEQMKKKAREMLKIVGLSDREDHHPNELSGGQQQRVAIARALVNEPSIILADEPTGNLDTQMTNEIMNLFTHLNDELGITILIVTHEPDVADFAKRKIVFRDGVIIIDEQVKRKKNIGYHRDRFK